MKRVVEIVCCTVKDCIVASHAGAGRIELCSAIELGGLTPSIGVVTEARLCVDAPLMVMLRPRPGNFCYNATEFNALFADFEAICGAVEETRLGFVFGFLRADNTINQSVCETLVSGMRKQQAVFHRAFDQVPDPFEALETLIDLGFTRILTSGLAPTAAEGADMLKRLIDKADGRIEIMPGGGVRSGNVAQILGTGCTSVHLAPRRPAADGAMEVDPEEVSAVVQLCH